MSGQSSRLVVAVNAKVKASTAKATNGGLVKLGKATLDLDLWMFVKPTCKCHFDYDLKTQVKVFLTFTCVSPQSIQDPRAHQIIRFQVKIPDFHEMRILFRLNSYAHHFSPDPSTSKAAMAWIK